MLAPLISSSYWRQVLTLVAVYWFSGWTAFHMGDPIAYAYKAILWPPVGIGVFALMKWGLRLWPGILLGELITSATLGAHRPLVTQGAVALGGTLEVVLAVSMFERALGRPASLEEPRAAVGFMVLAAGLGPSAGAFIGTIAFVRTGIVAASDFRYVLWDWWTGDMVSVLILTPWLLAMWKPMAGRPPLRRRIEFAVTLSALLTISLLVFMGWLPRSVSDYSLTYLPVLVVAWMASRFGFLGATTASAMVAFVAIWGTLHHRGPFATASRFESSLEIQAFLTVVAATMLVVTSLVLSRRRAEFALAQKAVETEKVRELERFKTNILNATTHELRTPLASILGNAELLEDLGAPEEQPLVRGIQDGARRMEHMVDDLLLVGELSLGKLVLEWHQADLTALAALVVAEFQPQAELAGVSLTLAGPREAVWLPLDEARIRQALERLVDNGLKFTPTGGRVEVAVSSTALEAQVAVRDTGPGLPPEQLPRLFNRFYQVDPSLTRAHGGTGLGLAIARTLIEAHGGRIGAESRPGHGSRFWFSLPRAQAAPAESAKVEIISPQPTADDEPAQRNGPAAP
ncbi:MAG TPA: MASE1 domain-containing protein [Oscillatoriaceae cyanobacterium]